MQKRSLDAFEHDYMKHHNLHDASWQTTLDNDAEFQLWNDAMDRDALRYQMETDAAVNQ